MIVPVFANLDLLNGPSVTGNVVFDACLVNVSMVWENLQTLACRNSLLQLLRLELCMRLNYQNSYETHSGQHRGPFESLAAFGHVQE